MRIISRCFMAILVVAFSCSLSLAADHELAQKSTLNTILKRGELRIGLDAGYMPFEMTDKKGDIVGFDVDIAKEMAKAMGVKLVVVNTDFDGIIPALMADKFDIIISGMTINQERNLQINFAQPYMVAGQAILLHKKHEGRITSYKDLNDPKYTVVSRIGTTGEQATKRLISKAQYKSFEKEADGAMEVLNGQGDAFVYDLPFCAVFMAQQGGQKLVLLDEVFTYEPLGFGIKKGDPDFLNWLDNFLIQIKADGRYDRIYDKWIKGTDWLQEIQ